MLEDAFGAEHLPVLHTVELDLLRWMGLAVLDLTLGHLAGAEGRVRGCGHGQASQNLVVDRQAIWADLMRALVVGALDHTVLRQLSYALGAERVAAGEGSRLLVVVIVRLEADAALKYRFHFL